MKLKTFIPSILGILRRDEFKTVNGLKTIEAQEKEQLVKLGFSEQFVQDFEAALNKEDDGGDDPEDKRSAVVAAALGMTASSLKERESELKALREATATATAEHARAIEAKEKEIASLRDRVKVLEELPEPDRTAASVPGASPRTWNIHDDATLGGMPGEMYSLSRPYNMRAKAALLLREGKTMAYDAVSKMDYGTLKDDLGAFYRIPWRDRLQSFLVALPSLEKEWPLESGYQDLATLVNLWLGEFSQADNTKGSTFDKVVKGSYEFGTETLRMYGVMFVHRFVDLADLERLWIGSLNREGSGKIKWSFIEYILVETAKKLQNEREQRRVNGVRVNPDPNKPGRAMAAADGFYEFIRKRVDGHIDFTPDGGTFGRTVYQIKPFALPRITPANIGEVFYQGTSMIPSEYRDTGRIVLYIPSFMMPWYHKYNEVHYGRNTNYEPNITYVKEFPSVRIVTVPNADNHHRVVWTFEGNFHTYEHVPGEMLAFQIEQEDWSLKVWSNWKEGLAALAVGFKYTDKARMDGSRQLVWCNDYDRPDTFYVESEPGSNPSALLHSSIKLMGDTDAYEVTDIEDAATGQVISLQCGGTGVSIKAEGRFSLLTAAWNPSAGDTLRVMRRADGKFIELGRDTVASGAYRFEADAATPSVAGAETFMTGDNTGATTITDLKDAVAGTVYTIHGSGSAKASVIENSGKFVLTKKMTLAEGTFIRLVLADDGKFYEVTRG